VQGALDAGQEFFGNYRLQQAARNAGLLRVRPHVLVDVGGDEDRRHGTACRNEPLLQIDSAHARHAQVDDEARIPAPAVRQARLRSGWGGSCR